MAELPLEALRQYRSCDASIIRGEIPEINFKENYLAEKIIVSFLIFFFPTLLFGMAGSAMGIIVGIMGISIYLCYPIFYVTYVHLRTEQKPSEEILNRFGERYKKIKAFMLANDYVAISEKPKEEIKAIHVKRSAVSKFRLWLGSSTGFLVKLWHRAGMAEGQHITLDLEDACQNVLVLGGIGSGKTSCVMQPLLLQCLDQKCGGLIFDIKGDVKNAVEQFATATKRKLIVLGPHYQKINLLDGLTPEIGASFLKSAFLLGENGRTDSFWVDTASELCRNSLGVLSFLPKHYSLQGLYLYLFDPETKDDIDAEIFTLLPSLEQTKARLLKTYQRYNDSIFALFDTKIKSGVLATVAQALAPFNHPDLLDAFCSTENSMVKMSDMLSGTVYLVDMPLSVWGLGGKVAYTFIKLRFFNLMQNRQHAAQDKKHPVFFMCDEFQEIVSASRDGLSDLNFWDKSRSSKTIGIISSQSIASFYAALGNHDTANALLQNFRQKLCLRTEDPITLDFMGKLIGHARIKKLSVTRGYDNAGSDNTHCSSNTISDAREGVVDAQLFRELLPGQAVAILSLNGHSMDDVLTLCPIYVD